MGIHEDAEQGILFGNRLARYTKDNLYLLEATNPKNGLTPLAAVTVGGYTEVIEQLLKKGVKANTLSSAGETPLLLAAWKTENNRPRIIQMLLAKTPPNLIDTTAEIAKNNTPLMFAVMKRDIESIRLLRRANASLTLKNNDGINAEEMAEETGDEAVVRALNPEEEEKILADGVDKVVGLLLFAVAWVNKNAREVVHRMYGFDPYLKEEINDDINGAGADSPSKAQFMKNVERYIKKNPEIENFFKNKPNYITEFAQKVAYLENDASVPSCNSGLLSKSIKTSLYQQVLFCDDSSSMRRYGRWESQRKLVHRITEITGEILHEEDYGASLRFINQEVEDDSAMTSMEIRNTFEEMRWQDGGDTEIGMSLRSKALEPLVYSKLESKSLKQPFLISIITDGNSNEKMDAKFVDVMVECGDKLEAAGYPRESVKFLICQVGPAKSAANFLKTIGNNTKIANVVYCTSDQLDENVAEFHENERNLDGWLIETLLSPIKDRE